MSGSVSFRPRGGLSVGRRLRRLFLEQLEDRSLLATIVVTGTGDNIAVDGLVTLREAITAANTNTAAGDAPAGDAGLDTINFNIPGAGVHTISPASALPTITDPVVIDGYTQPGAVMNTDPLGFNGTLLIELNGASAGPGAIGLTITAGNSTVRGLVVNRFLSDLLTNGDGIQLATNGGNHVEGNFLGTDPTASSDLGNVRAGVRILDSAGNTIGGLTPAARNVISGNNDFNVGLFGATSGQNLIQGNLIGTNAAGSAALGGGTGVRLINAPDNTIGGTAAGARNVISGLGNDGVEILSNNTLVQGNFIGTNASGTAALQNFGNGVRIVGATNTTIGGTTASARNVISGNRGIGVAVFFSGSSVVQKNFIGVAADGTSALANLEVGVRIEASSNNIVLENTIALNNSPGGEGGVIVVSGTGNAIGNAILANSIFGNTGLGIDLARNGVTANDTNDPDTGPNNLQNFPVLTSVTSGGGTTTFQGTLNSLPNTNFRIEFFASTAADPSGFGEGQNFVGFTTITTNASGDATFNFNELTQPGTVFTATATRLDGQGAPIETSEFSGNFVVQASEADLAVTKVGAATVIAGQNITYTVTVTNNGPAAAQNVVLTDTVPPNTTFVGLLNISQGAGSQMGGLITASFGTVTVGTPATLTFVVTASASAANGTIITNSATATSDASDPTPGNNTGTVNTTVLNAADLVVTKTGQSNVLPGESITYTLTVTNNGPIAAQNVVLTDTVPANTTFAGFLGISQGSASQMGDLITANFGTVTVGTPATLTFVVTTDASTPNGTIVTNTATATSDTPDPNTANNAGSETTRVGTPGLPECEVITLNLPGEAGTARVEEDADNPGDNVLIVTGTSSNDVIVIEPQPRSRGLFRVIRNNRVIVTFISQDVQRIVVFALAGNDKVVVNGSMTQSAILFGDEGNDFLYGARGVDGLEGGSGIDRLFGGLGDDTLCGGDGNDFVYGQAGNDFAGGDAGNDKVFGEAGNDFLLGNDGNDSLFGGIGNDRMYGQAGNDQIFGEPGNDIGVGGDGNDKLFGGSGRDVLIGGDGFDTLFGEAHDDILVAGSTIYDEDDEALQAILAEWTSTNSYTTRVNNIRNGGGQNGILTLDDTTVIDDALQDTLWGNGGLDWFLFGDGDKLKDKARSELVN